MVSAYISGKVRYLEEKNMKKYTVLIISVLLLLCGCGRTFSFIVLNNGSCESAEMAENEIIKGNSLVYTADGDVFYADDYKVSEELTGVIIDPPQRRVTDAYNEAEAALERGERVLLIYIDGLGYDAFQAALDDGAVPVLKTLNAEKAASVYPTITPVNYAAMITGQPPKVNGVSDRSTHELSCQSIFDLAAEKGVSSYAAEGDKQILKLSNTQLELTPDMNGDGSCDDEIFENAMNAKDENDLLFVHFHSVDDTSHQYAPDSQEARDALIQVDEWCGRLMENRDGKVIILADHGQHPQDGTGDEAYSERQGTHGDFAASDIFIPFLTN